MANSKQSIKEQSKMTHAMCLSMLKDPKQETAVKAVKKMLLRQKRHRDCQKSF